MGQDPADCPEHVWASIGVTVVDGAIYRIWDCERCRAWTDELLDEDSHVPWTETTVSTR